MIRYPSLTEDAGLHRRELFQWGLAGGLAMTAGGLLVACGPVRQPATDVGQKRPAGQPRRGGHLTLAMNSQVKLWDPAIALVVDEGVAGNAIYNKLTYLDDQLQPQPDLAESWSHSPDLKSWTFKLRQGVQFHHGKPFTADDVIYTFQRILDPATKSASRAILSYIDRMERNDDHTVVFHLNAPTANVPWDVGMPIHLQIVPSDRTAEQMVAQPSGTGPFKLKEWRPGERVVFARNEDYWETGLPYLDGWTMASIPEETSRVAALTGGAVDVVWQLTSQSLPAVQGNPGLSTLKAPSGNYQPIVMKSDVKPFNDVRVRQAFKAVVDRPAFLQAVTQGLGMPGADQPIPEFMLPQLAKEVPVPKRDIARAKKLLADAGHPDGLDMTLWTSEGRPGMVESSVAFQEMARPAGIRIKIQKVPISTYWEEVWMKRELCTSNWTTRPTLDSVLRQVHHSEAKWNESAFSTPELDRLMDEARGEPDAARRAAIYVRAAKLIQEQGGSIISYFRDVISVANKKVHNYTVHPTTYQDFRAVWVDG